MLLIMQDPGLLSRHNIVQTLETHHTYIKMQSATCYTGWHLAKPGVGPAVFCITYELQLVPISALLLIHTCLGLLSIAEEIRAYSG